MKAKGSSFDVYVAPADFAQKYRITLMKGHEIRLIGSKVKFADADVILAREITTEKLASNGRWVEDTTFYMRNDDGPFWTPSYATQ